MPWRQWTRDQAWLLPGSLDDLLPANHPVRFVADFLDALPEEAQQRFGLHATGPRHGLPAYHPWLLLAVWVYGFMTGVRSSRALEAACRDQVPFLWLTGRQYPDHNTLWRFYKAHRAHMRLLLMRTVQVSARQGLVDWALQAVDGTKIAANAARERTLDAAALRALLARSEAAIADLEAQNQGGDDDGPPALPPALANAQERRARLKAALATSEAETRPVNLTDPDARLLLGRQGKLAGYNAQAVAVPLAPEAGGGLLVTAAVVTQAGNDQGQLLPMVHEAAAISGRPTGITAADAGYLSGATLAACAAAGVTVVMPDSHHYPPGAYRKHQFHYHAALDQYTCPAGAVLRFRYTKHKRGEGPVRVYQALGAVCRGCPAYGRCTTSQAGRRLERTEHEDRLQAHHTWMQAPEAQAALARRQQLIEPAFGILKERLGARRFLLRGLRHVQHEWLLLAAAFNLRTLARVLGLPGNTTGPHLTA